MSELPEEASNELDHYRRAREEAEAAEVARRTAAQRAARILTDLGMSQRDASKLLEVSYQRVSQILKGGSPHVA